MPKRNSNNIEISKIILENIRFLIKEKGMNIGQVEKMAKVSQGYIARTICANSSCSLAFAYNSAKIFGISLDDLFDEKMIEKKLDEKKKKRIMELEAELKALKGETE